MTPKLVAVPDSFKGTMTSREICSLMAQAASKVWPEAEVVQIPVADGGEGSVDCFLSALGGQRVECTVSGPFGQPVNACYGLLPEGSAVVELAACAGLPLAGERKNPEAATTFGMGELLRHARENGAKRFLCCLGGSATNDGGCGAAAACGVRFLDASGRSFVPVGGTLSRIASVDLSGCVLRDAEVITVCDVDNPLCGPKGAAWVFAPQKGADAAMCRRLEQGLAHLASVLQSQLGIDLTDLPGAGAAGGMGGGTAAFFGATLRPGIEVVLDAADFDRTAATATLVLTGEGRFDAQSLRGKVPVGVARRCARLGVPCAAVVGDMGADWQEAYAAGLCGVFPINRIAAPYAELRERAPADLLETVCSVLSLWKAARGG